jgi:hypothetical protein
MMNKEKWRETWDAVRQILLSKWDPICVSVEPAAKDEYDSYIGGIYGLLDRGVTAEQLSEHLFEIETKQMGLTNLDGVPLGDPLLTSEARADTVAALLDLRTSMR